MIKLQTPVFRVAFPAVFEPKALTDEQKPKYSIVMLFVLAELAKNPAEKALFEALKKACQAVAADKWPKGIPANLNSPFKDGAEKVDYQGFGPGTVYVNAKSNTRPGLVDQNVQKIMDKEDFYGGCYARATVNPFAWEYAGKKGISFGLLNLQKVKDGEPFGGRSRAEDDFSAVASAAEETPDVNLFG